jgi:hypothetical protein
MVILRSTAGTSSDANERPGDPPSARLVRRYCEMRCCRLCDYPQPGLHKLRARYQLPPLTAETDARAEVEAAGSCISGTWPHDRFAGLQSRSSSICEQASEGMSHQDMVHPLTGGVAVSETAVIVTPGTSAIFLLISSNL